MHRFLDTMYESLTDQHFGQKLQKKVQYWVKAISLWSKAKKEYFLKQK